jgi:hypothetical protein
MGDAIAARRIRNQNLFRRTVGPRRSRYRREPTPRVRLIGFPLGETKSGPCRAFLGFLSACAFTLTNAWRITAYSPRPNSGTFMYRYSAGALGGGQYRVRSSASPSPDRAALIWYDWRVNDPLATGLASS